MGLRRWVGRLEKRAEHLYETLRLEDGTAVKYRPDEMLEALSATIRRREHRLLPYVRRADTTSGMAGLIRELEASRARIEALEKATSSREKGGQRWGV